MYSTKSIHNRVGCLRSVYRWKGADCDQADVTIVAIRSGSVDETGK